LAAFEAHFDESEPADMYLFGWVDEENQEVEFGLCIPGMLGFLVDGDPDAKITGLNQIPEDERPPVNIVFQTYHAMVAIGMALIGISLLGVYFLWRGTLFSKRWMLYLLAFSVLLPQIANQIGWASAEIGRQPWIVYGLLKTSDALSKAVSSDEIIFSLILFGLIYLLLFIVFIFLLDGKIKHGPDPVEEESDTEGKADSNETAAEKI
jgi:cytochrome d ubiquinol oxidase subunit I